ncbi:MAG: EAL domain-containing protein, partial [Actinomycetota bacterium]
LPDPVIGIDRAGTLRYANLAAAEILEWNPADVIGTSVLQLIHPDDHALAVASLDTISTKSSGALLTVRARTGRATWRYLEVRGTYDAVADEIMLVARDVSDRHALELGRGDSELLRAVMANMHGMVLLVDAIGVISSINGAVTRLLGHDPERVDGRPIVDLFHPDDRERMVDALHRTDSHETTTVDGRLIAIDGDDMVCEFTINNLLDDPIVGSYVVTAQIATALADARDRVDFLAEHDNRTGLLNRDGFVRAAGELIAAGGGLGVLLVDIVQFRSINELYGEAAGDAVLAAVAERLDRVRIADPVTARVGGDQFVLAVRSASERAIQMMQERITRDVPRPVAVGDQQVTFSIRTAVAYEPHPQTLDALLIHATNELASARHRSEAETTQISRDALDERRAQLEQLRNALDDDQIQPFFQPIVRPDGSIAAVEALVRWVHPVRGVLGADAVLPLAQMAGLGATVDDVVIEKAMHFAARLERAGYGDVGVHINIDPKMIAHPSFGASFLDRCRRHHANPAQLVVEITENDLLAPGASSLANMQRLRFAGIHVSIDDFGTGYSSLSHLLELPVDGVKIDRRFVAGIDVDPAATNLTTAIIGLSDSLGLTCVAEGVEQPYQRDRLQAMGCRSFQGWLYSAAVSADEAMAMVPRIVPIEDQPASQRVPL